MENQPMSNQKSYRFLTLITALNVTFQLISDVTAGKLIAVFGYPVSITVLYFPFTYIISDILTEVYGYARARSVLWTTLISSVIAGLLYQVVALWPPANIFGQNDAYVTVFQTVPRILLGGWLAVFTGDIANNFTLAKLKLLTNGRFLWIRTISSTVIGQLVNTAVFYLVALSGILPTTALTQAIVVGWLLKTSVEVIFTPITYLIVSSLKKVEKEDFYDRDTNFNPFIK
jgi:queuosine precursor transporter